MTTEQAITQAAARAKVAGMNGDEDTRAYWEQRAVLLSDQREAMRLRAEFNDPRPSHA